MKLLLADSGILIRLVEQSDPQHAVVFEAVRLLQSRSVEILATLQNFAEFWNVCTRPKSLRNGFGLSVDQTRQRVEKLRQTINVVHEKPSTFDRWLQLVISHRVHGKQVHDARLVANMLDQSISHILTLNPSDFQRYAGITVLKPADVIPTTPLNP